MSQNNNNNSASPAAVVAKKEKKPALSAQSLKHMVFGNWLIERLVAGGMMNAESVNESRKIIGMWSSVDEQIALYDGFTAELKTNTKEMKLTIRQFHKPPKAAKKAKTAASEGEKKRGRKKKEVTEEQDPIIALNDRLVAAAQSDEPIVAVPEYVRTPKEPEPEPETPAAEPTAKADEKADKDAKVDEKLAKTEAKAAEKATKEAAKAEEKAAKASAKAEEKDAKEAAKKDAKEAAKAEKELAKAEAKAAKPAKVAKTVLPIPLLVHNSPVMLAADDDEEDEELECEVFKLDGVEYLIDSDNNLYDRNTNDIIGKYDATEKTLKLYK